MIIHKKVASILPAVSKDLARLILQQVYISPDEVVTTDGHLLVRMPLDNTAVDDMPKCPGEPVTEPVLIDPETLKKAVSNIPKRPVLRRSNYINITKDGDRLLVNSGLPVVSFPVQCEQEEYANYKAVIPDYADQVPLKFALDGKILKILCDMAIKHGDVSNRITLELPTVEMKPVMEENGVDPVTDENGDRVFEQSPVGFTQSGIKFTINDDNKKETFTGVIMPLRIEE